MEQQADGGVVRSEGDVESPVKGEVKGVYAHKASDRHEM